ncbi:MAG TPA: protein kinase [Terriglobales bacterium]|nr:protein kinase [Terriglobales bacterium]
MLGETIGHYRISEQLGAGGMGVVYKARDLRLERDVAIKVVRPDAASPMLQAAFLREARLAGALHHPGIVTVYDILTHGTASGTFECIVMEYAPGTPLSMVIPESGLPVERALSLARNIGAALAAAHAAGIVHRDLKPANIIVGDGDHIKILDFGLAKFAGPGTRDDAQTRAAAMSLFGDAMVGTLTYMAPEQARGEAVDQRADVFSFGAILYEMVAGRPPFQAGNFATLLVAIQTSDPSPLRSVHPHLPEWLEAVTSRALAKDPAGRFASVNDLVAALGQQPTLARPVVIAAPTPPALGSEAASIAVLAFRSLSPAEDDQYLAAGLAAEIQGALTGVPGLRLAPLVASLRPHEPDADPLAAASALDTRYVVSGTLRRAGERVRVSVELADTHSRRALWTHNYDRRLTDIFAVQEDISKAVVAALGGEIIRATTEFAHRTPTDSLDAFGLVRKAYHLWNYEFSLAGVAQALELLRRATELDPQYAAARGYLGVYLITIINNCMSGDLDADRREALESAALACKLAPEDPSVLECAALVWLHTSQYEKAVHCLKRAVRVAPFDLVAWGYLAFAYACAGAERERAEARTILHRLIGDAPDHPSAAFWHEFLAIACLRLGSEYLEEAALHGQRAVEMQPGFVFNQIFAAEALARLGRVSEARALLATVPAYNPYMTMASAETVALATCRSLPAVEQLCGTIRSLGLFPE